VGRPCEDSYKSGSNKEKGMTERTQETLPIMKRGLVATNSEPSMMAFMNDASSSAVDRGWRSFQSEDEEDGKGLQFRHPWNSANRSAPRCAAAAAVAVRKETNVDGDHRTHHMHASQRFASEYPAGAPAHSSTAGAGSSNSVVHNRAPHQRRVGAELVPTRTVEVNKAGHVGSIDHFYKPRANEEGSSFASPTITSFLPNFVLSILQSFSPFPESNNINNSTKRHKTSTGT
jgi:hypothetical protein